MRGRGRSSVRIRVVSEDTPRLGTMVQPMRRSSLFVVVLLLLGLWPMAAHAQAPAEPQSRVDVIKVEGAIDRPLTGLPDQHLEQAVADRAVIVLQVDSAGTIGQDGVALAQRLVELPVPVLVWVGPVPGAGERRGDAADGRGIAGGGGARLADGAAGSDRPAAHPTRVPPDLDATIQGWLDARDRHRGPAAPERGDARRPGRAVRVRRISTRHVGRRPAEQGGRDDGRRRPRGRGCCTRRSPRPTRT